MEGKGANINPEQKQERGAAHVAHLRNLLDRISLSFR